MNADVSRVRDDQCHVAFSRLMDEHVGVVRRVVYRIVLNEHDTDDVVQETFVKAFRKIDTYKGTASFSTWVCRIACNQAYSLLRKRKTNEMPNGQLHILPGPKSMRADAAINSREAHDEITRALAKLPDKHRAAITLTALEGKSVKDAAYILDCNLMTLYWRLKQARKQLGKELEHLLN